MQLSFLNLDYRHPLTLSASSCQPLFDDDNEEPTSANDDEEEDGGGGRRIIVNQWCIHPIPDLVGNGREWKQRCIWPHHGSWSRSTRSWSMIMGWRRPKRIWPMLPANLTFTEEKDTVKVTSTMTSTKITDWGPRLPTEEKDMAACAHSTSYYVIGLKYLKLGHVPWSSATRCTGRQAFSHDG